MLAAEGRTSSIEWEPKTLTLQQLKYAREEALSVVLTKTSEEAIRIFTEGLKPAFCLKNNFVDSDEEEEEEADFLFDLNDGKTYDHSHAAIKRDPVTAPF